MYVVLRRSTLYLVGGTEDNVELERRLGVCNGGSIALPQLRDRRPLAKQTWEHGKAVSYGMRGMQAYQYNFQKKKFFSFE